MRRLVPISALVLVGIALAAPASAYCIRNQANISIIVKLETPNPLGGFHKVVRPGQELCCDWFDRQCNPSGRQDDILQFRIRDRKRGMTTSKYFCQNARAEKIYGLSNGVITVTRPDQEDGQFVCASTDFFWREVKPETHRPKKRHIRPIMPPPVVIPDGPPDAPDNLPAEESDTAGEGAAAEGERSPATTRPSVLDLPIDQGR